MANLLFIGSFGDKDYLPYLKGPTRGHKVYLKLAPDSTWLETRAYCRERSISGIVTTSKILLEKLIGRPGSIDNWQGSLVSKDGIDIVFLSPLKQMVTVPYGEFIAARYISKLTSPDRWMKTSTFSFSLLTAQNYEEVYQRFHRALAIAVDIETLRENLRIRCIGFTAIYQDLSTETVVLPIDSMFAVSIMRLFCALPVPKIFQNGKYDISYLTRWNCPVHSYLWDTATMFHCWYAELPKDLAYQNAFFARDAQYWKDLAESQDILTYYEYNGRDTWATANVFLAWMLEAPEFAKNNYLQEFPLTFPCHLAEMTGLKRDSVRLQEQRSKIMSRTSSNLATLRTWLNAPKFNTNSPVQVMKVLHLLGCKDIKSTNEKDLQLAMVRHPLINLILDKILEIRGDRKLLSQYLRTDEDITKTSKGGAKELNGTILYSINPHGTDTGRLASREHHFWCGLQIHNVPRGYDVKSTICAFDDFRLAEVDLEKAESWHSGYISGDENLIAAVNSTDDFHSINANGFFGIPYADIFDNTLKKVKDKKLRDLSKRTNHGATYNMGENVLILTMGLKAIWEAQRLLKLPGSWTPKQVAGHLLNAFDKRYPGVRGRYYTWIKTTLKLGRLLTGATGWTRYCFGDPTSNKQHLNSYVAHCPQSLNAMNLNKAWMKVFYEIAIDPRYSSNFKLCAQIHDSILFQFREGHEYLAEMVRSKMEIPITIKGCDSIVRTYTVPAAIKAGPDKKGAKYWSDCE